MAKKPETATTEENPDTGHTDTTPEEQSTPQVKAAGASAPAPTSGEVEPPVNPPEDDNKPEPQFKSQVTAKVLSVFSPYDELYVDDQGGSFTKTTPERFRTNATLYTNPYHKS